jgi:hypothetical protein
VIQKIREVVIFTAGSLAPWARGGTTSAPAGGSDLAAAAVMPLILGPVRFIVGLLFVSVTGPVWTTPVGSAIEK